MCGTGDRQVSASEEIGTGSLKVDGVVMAQQVRDLTVNSNGQVANIGA